jgi:alpha-galactosidase
MTTWFDLLRTQLDLSFLQPAENVVPFGLPPVPEDQWQVGGLQQQGEGRWQLNASTGKGLEAILYFRFFADTRAVELWGEIVHRGQSQVTGIRQCLTLDTVLRLTPEFGQPWVRSINGVRFLPNYFPPHDFGVVDRQLINTPQIYTPLILSGLADGRTSGENLPCAILGDEAGTAGLAFMLEWSGLWSISFKQPTRQTNAEVSTLDLQVQIGLWGLALDLQPGQSLPLPRLLIAAYQGGLEAGGNALRRHIRRQVMPKLNGEEVLPPTSFNHWFAFANQFSADKLKPAVDASSAAGLEYFCVDGGWFCGDFRNGIGNWEEGDPAKFPEGIRPFSDYVRAKGMKYGTWFEPEWANKQSELYKQHPDWFWETPLLSVPVEPGFRFQNPDFALMNFGLAEVQQWWLERICRAYQEWGVRWIRWDYNQMPRPNWEFNVVPGQIGWRQIQHVQGLYHVLDEILAACPDLFIEQCASGGHRIELGTVRRGHSFWMNDHTTQTDIVRVMQHGLNTVLPGNFANTNLCQARHDFSDYDFLSHGAGGFGYSGKIWEAPRADFERYAAAVQRFKQYRHLLMGDYSRPTGQPRSAYEYAKVVFSDGGEVVVMEFNQDGHQTAKIERSKAHL